MSKEIRGINYWMSLSKGSIEHRLGALDRIPPDKVPINYFGLAMDARCVAIYSLILGNKTEALHWFKKSSGYYSLKLESERALSGKYNWGQYGSHQAALEMAYLSGDDELVKQCIKRSLEICGESLEKSDNMAPGYYFYTALVYFLNDDIEKAKETLERVDIYQRVRSKNYFEGLKTILQGLINGDWQSVIIGLNRLLQDYTKEYEEVAIPYENICIRATVFFKIARERGIVVHPDSVGKGLGQYVPWYLVIDRPATG